MIRKKNPLFFFSYYMLLTKTKTKMKKITLLLLFFSLMGLTTTNAGGFSPEKALKVFDKTKNKVDKLATKYKPYKDLAVNNMGLLSPDLQKNMKDLDGQVAGLSSKLDRFPNASVTEQVAMAATFKDDYKVLKKSTKGATKALKGLKLPGM